MALLWRGLWGRFLFYGAFYGRFYGAYERSMGRSMAPSMGAYVYGLWIRGGGSMGGLWSVQSTAGAAFYRRSMGPSMGRRWERRVALLSAFYGPSMAPSGGLWALRGPPTYGFSIENFGVGYRATLEARPMERSMGRPMARSMACSMAYATFYGAVYGAVHAELLLVCAVCCAVPAQPLAVAENSREFCEGCPMGSNSHRIRLFCCLQRCQRLWRELSRDSAVAAAGPLSRGCLVSAGSLSAQNWLRYGVCRR